MGTRRVTLEICRDRGERVIYKNIMKFPDTVHSPFKVEIINLVTSISSAGQFSTRYIQAERNVLVHPGWET